MPRLSSVLAVVSFQLIALACGRAHDRIGVADLDQPGGDPHLGGDWGTGDPGDGHTGDATPPYDAPWPAWIFSHWVWEGESTQASAIALVDDYLARNSPVGAIVIDSPWETGYNTFAWEPARFPDPQGMINYFHGRGVRVVLWIVSMVNTDVPDLYSHAASNSYFMQLLSSTGPATIDWWKGTGSLLDYWSTPARTWWHSLMQPVLAMGIDGWKTDGTDFSATTAPYSPGAAGFKSRTEYSDAYYRDFFTHTRQVLGNDRVLLARPVDNYGYDVGGAEVAFAPRDINFAGWVGDQDATFEGLRAALNNMYYSAAQGYLAFGSDIGGYRTEDGEPLGRTKELFVRWAQLGAFSPIMENGGGGEHRPWIFDSETQSLYRVYTNLHYQLIPYLKAQALLAWAESRSMVTFTDKATYRYLLGPDVFVAPVIESDNIVEVTFPAEGRWVFLFDRGRVLEPASTHTFNIPLTQYPVFLREGSELASSLVVNW
jgi:alpha-D-xyloside xylohydrolase